MTHTHTTHDTHTGGWLLARHRSTPRAIARRRSPPRSPVAAAGPRGILLFLIVRARVARRLRRVARRPSVTASIHPSVPHRTAKKPREGPPPSKSNRLFRPIGWHGRTEPRRRTNATKSNEIERTKSNERTKERARKPRARAPTRSRGFPPVLLPSLVRVRSFASSRGRCV